MRSVRGDLINILNLVAESKDLPITFATNVTSESIRLVSDLIDNGYLDGSHVEDAKGVPCHAIVTGITIPGREYVDELEAQVFSASSKGKLIVVLKYGAVFILGIIGTLLAQWFAKKLGLN